MVESVERDSMAVFFVVSIVVLLVIPCWFLWLVDGFQWTFSGRCRIDKRDIKNLAGLSLSLSLFLSRFSIWKNTQQKKQVDLAVASQKTATKHNVYVLGLSNESASWHLLDPYQMFWPNMCICMPEYVQSCSAYSAEARRHFESICSTLSQRATQRSEIMSNSFETDTCSTRSLLILRVCPPKIRNWTEPSSLCHFSMLYTDNTQR